ncbi:MAG: LysM peptidoglycan-binding domain-containing protein [Anaerolineales bacterium]
MSKMIRLGLGLAAIILSIFACNLSNNAAEQNDPALLAAEASTLNLVKTAVNGTDVFNSVGQVINYTYVVKNNGTAALPGPVTVTDNKTTVACPALNTVGNNNDALDPTESITCTASYTVNQADLNSGMITNNATALAGGVTSNVANAVVNTTASKVLSITTTANPTTYSQANQVITFTYVIKNTGPAALGQAQYVVTDERIGNPFNCDVPKALAPNDTVTCQAQYTITQNDVTAGAIVSRATASGGGAMTVEPATVTVNSLGAGGQSGDFTPGSTITYKVVKGEWMLQISRCFGADFNAVWKANPSVIDPDFIEPNEVLTLPNIGSNGKIYGPPCVVPYTVVSGDTWESIAAKFNADLAVLKEANKDRSLTAGTELRIPINSAGSTPATPPPSNGNRITFPAGSTTVTINGTVPAGGSVRYLLAATNGQTLTVNVTAPANEVALGITSPVNAVIKQKDAVLTFNGPITANGDHVIELAAVSGTNSKTFSMVVTLTTTNNPPPSAVERVADINAGAGDSSPSYLAVFNGVLYFRADGNDGAGGELWKYDGTTKTAAKVADISAGAGSSEPAFLTPFKDALYFRANGNDGGGTELWRFNGSAVGRLTDINPIAGDANPSFMAVFNDNLYFSANGNDGGGVELWRTDGNTASRVADIYTGTGNSNPAYLTVFNNALYFSALSNDGFGIELYKFDGTNVTRVTDINPNVGNSAPAHLAVFNGVLYFSANANDGTGTELWKYDGTNASRVADINVGAGDSAPSYLNVFNNALYFSANGNDNAGFELWKFDGTNISRVADINKSGDSNPSYLAVYNNELYFQANGGDGAGKELWKFKGP